MKPGTNWQVVMWLECVTISPASTIVQNSGRNQFHLIHSSLNWIHFYSDSFSREWNSKTHKLIVLINIIYLIYCKRFLWNKPFVRSVRTLQINFRHNNYFVLRWWYLSRESFASLCGAIFMETLYDMLLVSPWSLMHHSTGSSHCLEVK